MKKFFLLLFILLLVYSYGFADIETSGQNVIQSQGFKGRVESFILPDPVNSVKREIVVINSQGQKMSFVLTSGIAVYGPAWEVLSLKKIKPGDKVLVEYTITKKDDFNRAISIMIMAN